MHFLYLVSHGLKQAKDGARTYDPLLLDAFGQGDETVLQAPPDQQLGRSAAVLGPQFDYFWVFHAQSSSQRCVCFDDDVVLLAEAGDVLPGIEWVDFDLIDYRLHPRFRSEQFVDLCAGQSEQVQSCRCQISYVLDAKVAHSTTPDQSVTDGVFDSPPALQPRLLASVRTVEQEQVDIPKPAFLDTLFDRGSC